MRWGDLGFAAAFIAVWLVLQLVVLPRLGVSTWLRSVCRPAERVDRATPGQEGRGR